MADDHKITSVEHDMIVIRIPFTVLQYPGTEPRGFVVTNPAKFAPHVARELEAENDGENMYLDCILEEAIIRAAIADAPGVKWDDDSAEDQALHEAENDSK